MVRAILFDVFGTVVDWRSGIAREAGPFLSRRGIDADRYEFAECLRLLVADRALGRSMAERGREYVLANYRWDEVLDRAERALEDWT